MHANAWVAEGVGFEPTVRLRARRFSRPVYSTTLAPLRGSMVCNQAGCRDNKCQGFGQEEPVWLTRACALLPPNDDGLRTQRCSWRRCGCLRRRRPRRFVAGGGVQDLNCRPKGGHEALPDLPGECWRKLDRESAYPSEFVKTTGEELMGADKTLMPGPLHGGSSDYAPSQLQPGSRQ
jgi:hypothetical protein